MVVPVKLRVGGVSVSWEALGKVWDSGKVLEGWVEICRGRLEGRAFSIWEDFLIPSFVRSYVAVTTVALCC